MTTASTISTLFGKMARFSPLKRGRRLNYRFLCPNCLHFGGFDFACGECWTEIPGYSDRKKTFTCHRCRRSLISADGDGVRAYCKQCKGNCDRAIYHQRRVRVVVTLRTTDSQALYQAVSGQESQPQGGIGYVYDGGEHLTYVLDLSALMENTHSLPRTHALWAAQSIWLDMSACQTKEPVLELAVTADRFIRQGKLTEEQVKELSICIPQAEIDPTVRPVLQTRFGKVTYEVLVTDFLCESAPTKLVVLDEVGYGRAIPALCEALKDRELRVREQAVWALAKIGKPAMPTLHEALKDSKRFVRERAAVLLVKMGEPAMPALIAALKDRDVYGAVASELITFGEEETLAKIGMLAVPGLIAAPKDSKWTVPEQAALVKIGEPAVPALIAALKDNDWRVREQASVVLVKIGKPAVRALCEVLKDNKWRVRRGAAAALGEIGDAFAAHALCEALNDSKWDVRERAVWALVRIGKSAVPALREALKDSDLRVREQAALALVEIGKPAVPALCEELKDRDEYEAVAGVLIRISEEEALVKIGKPAVPALIAALKDRDVYEAVVARVLIRIGEEETLVKIGKPAVPALIAALRTSNSSVRKQAEAALRKIGKPAVPTLKAVNRKHNHPISPYICDFCEALRRLGAK
jgi:HEAT repeat protein